MMAAKMVFVEIFFGGGQRQNRNWGSPPWLRAWSLYQDRQELSILILIIVVSSSSQQLTVDEQLLVIGNKLASLCRSKTSQETHTSTSAWPMDRLIRPLTTPPLKLPRSQSDVTHYPAAATSSMSGCHGLMVYDVRTTYSLSIIHTD